MNECESESDSDSESEFGLIYTMKYKMDHYQINHVLDTLIFITQKEKRELALDLYPLPATLRMQANKTDHH
jgi:hypothetical protein